MCFTALPVRCFTIFLLYVSLVYSSAHTAVSTYIVRCITPILKISLFNHFSIAPTPSPPPKKKKEKKKDAKHLSTGPSAACILPTQNMMFNLEATEQNWNGQMPQSLFECWRLRLRLLLL